MQQKDSQDRHPGSVGRICVSHGVENAQIVRSPQHLQPLTTTRPGAPPVYCPQAPQPLQPKRGMPGPPPVYKPAQPQPLQPRNPLMSRSVWQPGTAPLVYRLPAQSCTQAQANNSVLQNRNLLAAKPNAPAQKIFQSVLRQAGVAGQLGAVLPGVRTGASADVNSARAGSSLPRTEPTPIQSKTSPAPSAQMATARPLNTPFRNRWIWTPGVLQRASSFADLTPSYSGQIYGIFKNTNFPGKAKLEADDCVYVGKTVPGDVDVGTRFVQHVNNDEKQPWHFENADDDAYSSADDEKWEYIPREIVQLAHKTKAEVAAWESWSIQRYKELGAALLNKCRPISVKKIKVALAAGAIRKKHAPKGDLVALAAMDIS